MSYIRLNAIQPMQLPNQVATPQLDFSPLGNLIQDYRRGQMENFALAKAKRDEENKMSLRGLDPNDPSSVGKLIGAGEVAGGLNLYKTQIEQRDRERANEFIKGLTGGGGGGGVASTGQSLPTFAAGGLTLGLLKNFEGYRSSPYWDVNAHRVGYGSDTKTDATTGAVTRVTPGTRVTQADANADLARRSGEFQQAIIAQAPNFTQLPETARAALTSVAYNYGRLPASVMRALQTGDLNTIADSVAGLSGDNGGVNARRRMTEANLIRSGKGSVGGPAPTQVAALSPQQQGGYTPPIMSDATGGPGSFGIPQIAQPAPVLPPTPPPYQPGNVAMGLPPEAGGPQVGLAGRAGIPSASLPPPGLPTPPTTPATPPTVPAPAPQVAQLPAPTPGPPAAPQVPPVPAQAVTRGESVLTERQIAAAGPFPNASREMLTAGLALPGLDPGMKTAIAQELNRRATALGKYQTPAEIQKEQDEARQRQLDIATKERALNTPDSEYQKYLRDVELANKRGKTQLTPMTPDEFLRARVQTAEGEERTLAAKRWDKRITGVMEDAKASNEMLSQVGVLRELFDPNTGGLKTGAEAGLEKFAASLGIPTKNASAIQMVEAIVAKMTPQQKPEGYGSASDFDAKMFGRALVNLWNQPQGNKMILDVMEGLALNYKARARLMDQHELGKMSKEQVINELDRLGSEAQKIGANAVRKAYTGLTKDEETEINDWAKGKK